jgi:hypothetical protein
MLLRTVTHLAASASVIVAMLVLAAPFALTIWSPFFVR